MAYFLLGLGALSLAALVDLLIHGSNPEPSVLGLVVPADAAEHVAVVAGSLGVLAGVACATGVALLVSATRRRRDRERDRREVDAHRLETVRRLLEEKVEMLSDSVRELEARQTELRGSSPVREGAGARGALGNEGEVVVLPEAPRTDGSPAGR